MSISTKPPFLDGHKKFFIRTLHHEYFLSPGKYGANPTSVRHWCACKRLMLSTEISINEPAVIRACWMYRSGVNFCNLKYATANYSGLEGCVVNA